MSARLTEFLQPVFNNFDLLFGIAVAWVVLAYAFFAWRRARRGPWHPPIHESQVRFQAKRASGRSHKNWRTKNSRIDRCLLVTVTNAAILVELEAPFKWMVPAGFGDIEHYILRKNIRRIRPTSDWRPDAVLIEFTTEGGQTRRIELVMRQHLQFLTALA